MQRRGTLLAIALFACVWCSADARAGGREREHKGGSHGHDLTEAERKRIQEQRKAAGQQKKLQELDLFGFKKQEREKAEREQQAERQLADEALQAQRRQAEEARQIEIARLRELRGVSELTAPTTGTMSSDDLRSSIATPSVRNILVRSPSLIQPARDVVAAAGLDRLVLYKRTSQRVDSLDLLTDPVGRVEIFHSVPRNGSEAARVHGARAALVDDAYWQSAHARLDGLKRAHDLGALRTKGDSYAGALHQSLSIPGAGLVVVIGEIRYGALRFPDDSAMPIGDIVRKDGRLVAVIGCSSAQFSEPMPGAILIGTGRQITYREAIDIARRFEEIDEKSVRDGSSTTVRDLLINMQNASDRASRAVVGVSAMNLLTIDVVDT